MLLYAVNIYIAENILYFGCRSASKDQHYAEEWIKEAETGKLTFRTAFSRDSPNGIRRYVQDTMTEDIEMIWNIIDGRGGFMYICGYVFSLLNIGSIDTEDLPIIDHHEVPRIKCLPLSSLS